MKKLLLVFSLVLVFSVGHAQIQRLQAIFIYNFTKHIEWPTNARYGDFVIGVLGSCELEAELRTLAERKKIDNRPLVIKRFNTIEGIQNCHILFVPKGRADQLDAVANKVQHQNTLIISEEEGAALNGAGINFVVRNNRQKFEMNLSNVENHGLKVSNYLQQLAIQVK